MKELNRIEYTRNYLEKRLKESSYYKEHPEEGAYRLEHSIRVAHIGKIIAEREGFHVENMILGCLLHDVSYCMSFEEMGNWSNHGRLSAKIARPFLLDLGLNPVEVEEICYGIAIHCDDKADFEGERTPFALTIGEADNIDRFDAYRIYEGLHYKKYHLMSLEEKRAFVEKVLHNLEGPMREMPIATETGRQMWLEKIEFQIRFFKKLQEQIEHSLI